jgi:hypothetical protein
MAIFVNRDKELSRVDKAVTTLLDESRLLRTPIIEFYGVGGIGKTALLQKIEQDFKVRIRCIVGNAKDMNKQSLVEAINESVKKNTRVAIILDALDSASKQQLQDIENVLGQFINSGKLFVILASRDEYQFSGNRSIAHKLKAYPLQPLGLQHCEVYMSQAYNTIAPYLQTTIFEWTRGYPLAMSVMADAIYNKQIDLQRKRDQKQVLSIIIDKVINQSLLVRIKSDPRELDRFHTLFCILSVPRRSNLTLIKFLIERFAPKYQLRNFIAYTTFPQSISDVTSAFNWSPERAGYCIHSSIRNLFLLQGRIKHPKLYGKMHEFLAEKNEDFARQVMNVSELEYTRYLREFFYHFAHYKTETQVREQLTKRIEQIMPLQASDISVESFDNFLRFYEEFQQDEELKEVLKLENTRFALSLMRKTFIEVYKCLPITVQDRYLRIFFAYTSSIENHENFALIFEAGIRRIMNEEAVEVHTVFYDTLSQDQTLQTLLGEEVKRILSLFADNSLEER